jgi:hypothetical protein
MEEHVDNPSTNVLGPGVSPDDLKAAIERSGYPLQSTVVDLVLAQMSDDKYDWSVQEEWAFLDADASQVRQLDAFISCEIRFPDSDRHEVGQPRDPRNHLRARLDLLIECKQSELPYVFFVRESVQCLGPELAGLPHSELSLRSGPDEPPGMVMSYFDVLGLGNLTLAWPEFTAVAMTRAHRKGKALELSTEEAYRGLSLPLMKALQHYLSIVQVKPEHLFFNIRTVLPLVVLRAPIVAVHMEADGPHLEAVPWVRVARTEPADQSRHFWLTSELRFFDVVHVDYLSSYVSLALGTAEEIGERARRFAIPIITGTAVLPIDDADDAKSSESEQKPRPAPFMSMKPAMTEGAFIEWMSERWIDVHANMAKGWLVTDHRPS